MKPKSVSTNHIPQRARIFVLNETIIRTSPTLAHEIKLNESMVLLQLEFWISITDNFYDGHFWTYQSVRDMQKKAFPFWSIATINRAIHNLLAKGYIIEGNYNTYKYDKTRWFALNFDKLSELSSIAIRKVETQAPHDAAQNDTRANQNDTRPTQNETTIPENTTETTTDNINSDFEKRVSDDDYSIELEELICEITNRTTASNKDMQTITNLVIDGIPRDLVFDTIHEMLGLKPNDTEIKTINYFVKEIRKRFETQAKAIDDAKKSVDQTSELLSRLKKARGG